MKNPMVSVIVVTYNHETTIKQTIDSILNQETNFDVEIIVGEDCSTDNTLAICKAYDNKIKLITTSENVGMMANFTRTLKAAKGRYIALCDGDDYWTDPLKLQKQVSFLENNSDFSICFHDIQIYDEVMKEFRDDDITSAKKWDFNIEDLSENNFIHTPSVILRNDFELPSWFINLPMGDWSLYIIQIKNRKIKRLPGKMAVYRVHVNSNWSSKNEIERLELTKNAIKMFVNNCNLPLQAVHNFQKKEKQIKKRIKKIKPSVFQKTIKYLNNFRKEML